jgi:site-specific recombinase XerC
VPLNAIVRQVLDEWLDEHKGKAAEGERAVFVGRSGRRLSRRSVDDVVRSLGKDAGVQRSTPAPTRSCAPRSSITATTPWPR